MTRALGRDPARRCMPVAEWPIRDQEVWQTALEAGDILEGGGDRVRHAALSNRGVEAGYGRWLAWLSYRGQLDHLMAPADRITPDRVGTYLQDLALHNSTATQSHRLEELFIVATLADPARDWSWIRDLRARVRRRHTPVRDKRPHLVGAEDLVGLGHRIMQQATDHAERPAWRRALMYRDGLALALLALRPLRRANFAGLRLGRHVVQRGAAWWLVIEGSETKTGAPIEDPWPDSLAGALATYLTIWRPVLRERASLTASRRSAADDALWLSATGAAMDTQALYDLTTRWTRATFGRPVSPHLFRDCAATTIAVEDPTRIHIASQILGHRSIATTERHYNQARSVEAARAWQGTLERLRAATAADGSNPSRGEHS